MAALLAPQHVDELVKVGSLSIRIPDHDLSLRVLESRLSGSRLTSAHGDQYTGPCELQDTPERAEADRRTIEAWEKAYGAPDIRSHAEGAKARLLA